jgi:hypothetical protein
MNLLEVVSNTLFYRTEDGRITFRPLGARGPCYLLTEKQRITRVRIQAAYYCALFVGIGIVAQISRGNYFFLLGALFLIFVGGNYILYWLFAQGLSKTEPPPQPSPDYRREQVRRNNRAFGKPLLWVSLVSSAIFTLGGILIGFTDEPIYKAIFVTIFFGFCTIIFARRIRNQ